MVEGKYLRFISAFALAACALLASDDGKTPVAPDRSSLPPVLRNDDPADSRFVFLPGAPQPKAIAEPAAAKVEPGPVEMAERHEPPPVELSDPGRPILHRAVRPVLPEDFERDSGTFCQKKIGQWKELDAFAILGTPSSDRPAFDDNQQANGRIFSFSDPTNHYRQLELDFDGETGALRTVFVYPWKMTWLDCRRIWGANVSAAEAPKGRKFYSYLNKRVDVLVDSTGKVISIGLY
ncbi:MAG TPA: hypothetical protein VG456_20485 [Candidatus Sulfopaludibacter sp.]|nr:hypothetical protein [Candidatus Sulfopaludibacter sp.]